MKKKETIRWAKIKVKIVRLLARPRHTSAASRFWLLYLPTTPHLAVLINAIYGVSKKLMHNMVQGDFATTHGLAS